MKKLSYLSIILFIISAWFAVFFFWNFIENNNFVGNAMDAGAITWRGNYYEVIHYFMTNSAPYAFYALMTGVLGWVLMKIKERKDFDSDKIFATRMNGFNDYYHNGHHVHNEGFEANALHANYDVDDKK